ncbi:MAG: MFS transporter [Chloroflexota bacterium]
MNLEQSSNKRRKNMRLMNLYFFLYFAAGGFIIPFLSLYYRDIHLNGIQIGAVGTIGGLMGIIAAPFWGFISDRSSNKRLIFQITLIISGIFMVLVGQFTLFWMVTALYASHRFWSASNIATAENLAFRIAKPSGDGKKNGFGSMRLWGSLSWAVTSLLGGWLIVRLAIQVNMLAYAAFCTLAAFLLFFISKESFKAEEHLEKEDHKGGSVLRMILTDKYLLLMVAALALTNPLGNGIRQFEPIYMIELGISESLIGTAAMLSAFIEVPFMFWADHLIIRFGISKVLIIVFFLDLVRRLLVWIFPFGWVVFGMQVAMSVTLSLRLVTAVNMVNQRVPQKYTTTTLALITVTIFGISNMISSALSGVVYEIFSGRELYLMSAVGCLISLALALYAAFIQKKEPCYSQDPT